MTRPVRVPGGRDLGECTCGHAGDDHNGEKGSCLVIDCRCLRFTSAKAKPGMRRRPKAKPLSADPEALRMRREAWAAGARRKPCAVCRRKHDHGRVIRGHHIVTQDTLETICRAAGLDADRVLWDERNRLALCDVCHGNHHGAHRRVTREVLERAAPKVFQFARELDRAMPDGTEPATLELERDYPVAA